MSELMNTSGARKDLRWQLLTTASVLALLGFTMGAPGAWASDDDTDHPTVWIELGGQLERMDGGQTPFAPPFFDAVTKAGFESPLAAGRSSIYSNGAEGTISFMPDDSDWVFSGSVRYGRSDGHRFLHQQLKGQVTHFSLFGHDTKTAPAPYAETKADNSEAHVVVDFQAGKDVGLGLFGSESTSVISAGVRFAQFNAKSNANIDAQPDARFVPVTVLGFKVPVTQYHQYYASAQRADSFRGLGPSISWNASAPLGGHPQDGEVTFDWGANAAVLFGRQNARTHHHSSGNYHYYKNDKAKYHTVIQLPTHHGTGDRTHSVVTPNLGAFAGVSFRFDRAKVSVGYRGDFFFGAMDGGLDTRKSYNQEFYGPFATISIGG